MSKRHGHHFAFPRALWSVQPPAKEIRDNRWMIAPLHPEYHFDRYETGVHRHVKFVPVLGYMAMNRIATEFNPAPGRYIKTLERLIQTIEHEVVDNPRWSMVEREVGALMVMSFSEQIPFVQAGLNTNVE